MHYTLTEEQLFEYIKCPIRYDAIYNKHMITGEEPSMQKYLGKIATYFLMQLMDGTVVSTDILKRKWDKLSEQHPDYITPQRNLEGIDKLMRFYRWAENEELIVGDVSIPYELTLREDDDLLDFRGEITTIAVGKHGQKPYLLYLDFGNRFPDQAMLDMKLKYSLDSYATAKTTGKQLGIKVHHVKKDKDFFVMRSAMDYARMKKILFNVAKSIYHGLYYPRENVMCSNCDMINLCRIWKG